MKCAGAWAVLLLCLLARTATAADVVDLWPADAAPGFRHSREESVTDPGRDDERRDRSVSFVSRPTLTIHRAAQNRDTGAVVLVLPGGGYRNVVIDKEGHDIARWLNTLGVTAAVLKYRTRDPEKMMSKAFDAAVLADARRAMQALRSRADELGADPARIGVMGFSAGGDLAIRLAAASEAAQPNGKDALEKASSRPDFVALVYPGVPPGTRFLPGEAPPFFIVHACDDPKAPVLLSFGLAQDLAAAGVPVELHAYRSGDHGFALGLEGGSVRSWPTLFEAWLCDLGLLDRKVARVVENRPAARVHWPARIFWFAGGGAAFAAGAAATLLLWLLLAGVRAVARRRKAS